ncbi:MAG TPA: hypothetical protein VG795_02840 [Acidimicrobiia bacterium]|nr:hypothetical protein [Acidimicrobiia bacterium]
MTLRRALIAAVVSTLVLAGCGSPTEKLSPEEAVREAAKTTAGLKEGSFKLSVVGSEDDLNTIFNGGAPLTDEDREGLAVLRNGHIVLSTGNDKFGLDIKAGDLDHAFELRYVDKKLYARANVAGLAKLFGGTPEELEQTVQALASREGLEFVAAAAAGKWLEADFGALKGTFDDLVKGLQESTGGSLPGPEGTQPTESETTAVKDAFDKAFSEDVSIERLGSDSVGDHYLAKVTSLRSFYAKLMPTVQQYMDRLPSAEQFPAANFIPDKPGSLDVWVKDGRVSRVELDMAQFSPAPPAGAGRVALRLDIDREVPTLSAPSDAVTVDLAGLFQRFFGQFGQFLEGFGAGLSNYD